MATRFDWHMKGKKSASSNPIGLNFEGYLGDSIFQGIHIKDEPVFSVSYALLHDADTLDPRGRASKLSVLGQTDNGPVMRDMPNYNSRQLQQTTGNRYHGGELQNMDYSLKGAIFSLLPDTGNKRFFHATALFVFI